MKRILFAVLGLAACTLAGLNAQVFTGNFSFSGATGNTTSLNYNGSPIQNMTISALTKNGVTNTSNSNNFRATNWALDAGSSTLTGNIDTSKYFEFSMTSAPGFTFNATSFTFGVGRSLAGPRSYQWRSSLDSFANPISGYTNTNVALNENLGSGILSYSSDASTSATGNTLVFSTATFSNLSTVTFRFYGFNSEQTVGSGGFDGNFSFSGEAIPEPSTWALIGLGSAFVLWRVRSRKKSS